MKKILSILCSFACAVGISSCSEKAEDDRLTVYTSFYAMYDFAREIGGDCINVYNICPTGAEPHDFEPTAADIAKITDGDVFIYNGMGMESWTDSVLEILDGSNIITVNTSDEIKTAHDQGSSHGEHEHTDLHLWLNPTDAYIQMEAIAEAFIEADTENEDYYRNRLETCKEKIDMLIDDYNLAVSDFKSRDVIVSHAAYSGLCDAFKLNQIPLNTADNSQEPTPARLAEITDYIKTNNIKYIFAEPLGSRSVAQSAANDTGCEILVLDPFEGSIENKDYFTVMYENLDALKTALN